MYWNLAVLGLVLFVKLRLVKKSLGQAFPLCRVIVVLHPEIIFLE